MTAAGLSDSSPVARFRQWFGVGLLVVTFLSSVAMSVRSTLQIEKPDKTVLRIAHWQLERGYREAIESVIKDYEALHPGVRIEQVPLPDRVYAQSINTQLVSNTAPDLCEMGNSDLIAKDNNTIRYFLPLSTYVVRSNPYDRGTNLQDVAWKDTLLDGMHSGFRDGLADYYAVPTTLTSMRLYYNKTLLQAATGSSAAPATFGAWMTACQKIREYTAARDGRIVPIVSCYDLATMRQKYAVPFTSAMEPDLDLDLNGDVSPLEAYIGFCQKKVDPHTPAIRALFETMRAISDQMQQGFSAMDRQQAQFRFVNGLAGFMWTGSWDAGGTQAQAREKGFEIGIMRVPLPAPGEPNAQYVAGRAAETAEGGGVYGVVKGSQHIDLAVDFLMYLTSRSVNERLNQLAEWPPMTLGAKPSALMEPFIADPRGESTRVQLIYGTRTDRDVGNQTINYLQGDETLDTFLDFFARTLRDPNRGGDWAWWQEVDDRKTDIRGKERVLAQQQTLGLLDQECFDPVRYRRSLVQQTLRNDGLDASYLFQSVRGKPMPQF